MYGMPIAQALVFLAAVIVVIAAIQWRHFHPFLAIVVVAAIFGFIAGFPTSILGRVFGTGFSDMIYSPGLVVVAAALIAGIAETTTASDRLLAQIEQLRAQLAMAWHERHRRGLGPVRRYRRFAGVGLCDSDAASSPARRKNGAAA